MRTRILVAALSSCLICTDRTAVFHLTNHSYEPQSSMWLHVRTRDKPLGAYLLLFHGTQWRINLCVYLDFAGRRRKERAPVGRRCTWSSGMSTISGVTSRPLNNPWKRVARRHSLKKHSNTTYLREAGENTNDRIYVFIYVNHRKPCFYSGEGESVALTRGVPNETLMEIKVNCSSPRDFWWLIDLAYRTGWHGVSLWRRTGSSFVPRRRVSQ